MRRWSVKLVGLSVWLAGLFFLAGSALGCPCGCGAVGPLVMWPGEAWKLQFGLSKEAIDGITMADGRRGFNGGAESTDSLELGLARSLNDQVSLSFNAAATRDWHRDLGSEWRLADPSMGGRYILSQVDYERPWVPQIQLHATYKVALDNWARSEKARRLQVESANSSEFVPGLDLWFYRGEFALGLGEALLYRREVEIDQGLGKQRRAPGLGHRTSLGLSYTFIGFGQLMASLEREAKGRDRLDGELLAGSERLAHTLSLTGNLRVGDRQTLSLNGKLIGSLGPNKNSKRARLIGLSFIQAI